MSTLQVANVHLESTGNNRIQYMGSNAVGIFSSGTESLRITPTGNIGIGTISPITQLHVAGNTVTTGVVFKSQVTHTSKSTSATLTIAELLKGIIQSTTGSPTLTLPTGTDIEAGLPATFPVDMSFDFTIINTGTAVTVATNTGLTTIGSLSLGAAVSAIFRVRKTATNTYTVYRIA